MSISAPMPLEMLTIRPYRLGCITERTPRRAATRRRGSSPASPSPRRGPRPRRVGPCRWRSRRCSPGRRVGRTPPRRRGPTGLCPSRRLRRVDERALRGLDTRRTALFARATGEDAQGVAGDLLERVVAAFGDANAAGVTIVDEDGRQARLAVQGDREPAYVPPVAHSEERQQPDKGVLRRVQRAEELDEVRPGVTLWRRERRQGDPEPARLERRRWQVQGEDPDLAGVLNLNLLIERGHVRRPHPTPVQRRAVREVAFLGFFEDLDVCVYLDPGIVAVRDP